MFAPSPLPLNILQRHSLPGVFNKIFSELSWVQLIQNLPLATCCCCFFNNLYAKISSKLHLIHRWNISFKPLDWSLTNFSARFPHKFCNSPTLLFTEIIIWNEKDTVKYGDFPDRSLARSSRCWKLRWGTKKTTSSLDRSGRQLISCEPIQAVRVSCKPFPNNWFLSRLDVSRGLFSLVQSALALF